MSINHKQLLLMLDTLTEFTQYTSIQYAKER